MKKVLKKSFENFVDDLCASGISFYSKGNLCVDLEYYYGLMLFNKVFNIPRNYAVNITTSTVNECYYNINFYKIEDSYLILLKRFTFNKRTNAIDECLFDCDINEYFDDDRKVIVKNFIEPLQEIVKQMQQYYKDHNLSD